MDAQTITEGVSRTRSLFQGDPAAPSIFNCCLDAIAGPFHQQCQDKKWGVEIVCGFYLGLVCYADNYWLFATSVEMLQQMTHAWMDMLQGVGFHTPHDGLTWCTTCSDKTSHSLLWKDHVVQRSPRKIGFKVLGAWISFDNRCETELSFRLDKAWNAFYANRELLCCQGASFGQRLRYLEATVGKSLFWGAGSWKLTRAQRERLRGTQLRMVRRMLGARMPPLEDLESFCARTNGRAVNLLARHGCDRWDISQLKLYYDWMGYVARIGSYSPDRLTYLVLQYRDLKYIDSLVEEFGHQTHGRRLHVWRLEWDLFKWDKSWQDIARAKKSWAERRSSWLEWRLG